jgi:hypothetical protein
MKKWHKSLRGEPRANWFKKAKSKNDPKQGGRKRDFSEISVESDQRQTAYTDAGLVEEWIPFDVWFREEGFPQSERANAWVEWERMQSDEEFHFQMVSGHPCLYRFRGRKLVTGDRDEAGSTTKKRKLVHGEEGFEEALSVASDHVDRWRKTNRSTTVPEQASDARNLPAHLIPGLTTPTAAKDAMGLSVRREIMERKRTEQSDLLSHQEDVTKMEEWADEQKLLAKELRAQKMDRYTDLCLAVTTMKNSHLSTVLALKRKIDMATQEGHRTFHRKIMPPETVDAPL